MANAGTRRWSKTWLIGSLIVGVVLVAAMLVAQFGPPFAHATLVFQAAGAGLALCLIVAAVTFVLEVVRRVTSA